MFLRNTIFFSLNQLISCPARIRCRSSTIIDHILASYSGRVSLKRIIDIGIFIISLCFLVGKLLKLRQDHISRSVSTHSRITPLWPLRKLRFLNYETFIIII